MTTKRIGNYDLNVGKTKITVEDEGSITIKQVEKLLAALEAQGEEFFFGDHEVILADDGSGVNVGCTFVSKQQLKNLLK